jgi:peptide/nickel transport system substrate-binding protein
VSWAVDAKDKTKWVFKLRPGVKFHDGSAFNADAVVWNVRKVLDKDAVHFDASQVGVTASRMPTLRSARKIDDLTVELTTSEPDAFLPLNLTNLFMASPAHWQKKFDAAAGATPADKAKAAWTAFAADASGSGPFKMARFVAARAAGAGGQQGLLGPQAHAQDRPRGDAAHARGQRPHRGAAGGQVDWIEAPSPDAMAADHAARLQDLLQPAAARLALAAELRRGLALAGQARAPRRQPVRRPRPACSSCWAA